MIVSVWNWQRLAGIEAVPVQPDWPAPSSSRHNSATTSSRRPRRCAEIAGIETIGRDRPGMFRVRYNELWIGYSGSIGGACEIVRCEPPGRYDVVEIRAESNSSGITSTPRGHLIRHSDGRIEDHTQERPDR
jgi:hypothetical protein